MLRHPHGAELLRWARDRLRQELGGPAAVPPSGAWCDELGATFVTLRRPDGSLQGCIGSLTARRSIVADVGENAVAAGLHDPRSAPVRAEDVDSLDLELSVLSPPEPIHFTDQASAHRAIRPGVDGIIFSWRGRSATFLPSMWKQLPEVLDFLAELKMKAGLLPDFWDDDVRLFRYEADRHRERGRRV